MPNSINGIGILGDKFMPNSVAEARCLKVTVAMLNIMVAKSLLRSWLWFFQFKS